MTTTISPLTSSRKRRASSPSVPRATSSWSLVSSRQTAAGRSGASAASARSESGRRRGDSKATTVSVDCRTRSSSPGAARQEALEAPPVGRQARGDERRRDRRRPGQHLDLDVALDAGADQPVAGVGEPGVPASLISATRAPRSIAWASCGARSSSLALVVGDKPAASGSRAARRGGRRGGCPRRRRGRPRRAPGAGAAEMSPMFPIGVGQTISRPGIRRSAPARRAELLERHRRGADHPGVGPSAAARTGDLVHRRQRARRELLARRARAAGRPRPSRRRRSRSRRGRRCWRGPRAPTPSRRPISVEDLDRDLVAADARPR